MVNRLWPCADGNSTSGLHLQVTERRWQRRWWKLSAYGFTSTMAVLLESELCVTVDLLEREQKMAVLHKVMKITAGSLSNRERTGYIVKTKDLVEWNFVPSLVCRCWDIPDGMNLSAVRFSFVVNRPFVRHTETKCAIIGSQLAGESSLRGGKISRSILLKLWMNNISMVGKNNEVTKT